ncbi:MAG: endo-1,4-beta-xylanase [Prolixibacteraceae bacterium]|nr:endo-1,4-beta-xylanase [Prolixibacteraceae bacterium]
MKHFFVLLLFTLSLNYSAISQTTDEEGMKPVIIEAESGAIGSGFDVLQDGDISYVTTNSNFAGSASPEDSSRVITYQVSFQESGTYHLFARLRVGAGGWDDDSFFSGNGFGEKDVSSGSDWVMINGLAGAGYANSTDVVDDLGGLGSNVWKWVNITKNLFTNNPFSVSDDQLTRSFQVANREDGLQFDKFAFGKTNLYYTVEALDKVLAGTDEVEVDSSRFYPGPPLADGSSKFLGNLRGGSESNFSNLWNQLTPENEGKWSSVGNTSDSTRWNWGGLTSLYNYAKSHNIPFKHHCLVWGNQQPTWISALSKEKQLEYITTWIRQNGIRYPDMEMIDVVNEPLVTHNPPDGRNGRANYKEALGGDGVTGWDWVIKSFEMARQYIPNAMLLINDYGIINSNSATTSYLQIINLLIERGLIDGIGVQGHRFEFESASTTTLKNNLDRLAATGLPIYITEFDLGNLNDSGTPNDNQQLQLYKRIFPIIWEHPGVKGVTLWGYIENRMWQSTCYLVRTDGSWRPALTWLAEYIKENPTGIERSVSTLPASVVLNQNYPNPFSSKTTIDFSINEPQNVSLKLYNGMGQLVETLVDGRLETGSYSVDWNAGQNGKDYGNGLYIYQIVAGGKSASRTMLMLK